MKLKLNLSFKTEFTLILVTCAALLGYVFFYTPSAVARNALAPLVNGKPVLIAYSWTYSGSNGRTNTQSARTFAVFPDSLRGLSSYVVTDKDGVISANEEPFGIAILFFCFLIGAIAAPLYLWRRWKGIKPDSPPGWDIHL